jgi:hypothetical protein
MAVVKRLERESGDVYNNRPTVGEFMCEMSMDQFLGKFTGTIRNPP